MNQSPGDKPSGQNNNRNNSGGGDKSPFQRYLPIVIIALILTLLLNTLYSTISSAHEKEISYDKFLDMVDNDEVKEVTFSSDTIAILTREEAEKAALENEQSQKWLEGKTILKVIVVPGKIVNIVVA